MLPPQVEPTPFLSLADFRTPALLPRETAECMLVTHSFCYQDDRKADKQNGHRDSSPPMNGDDRARRDSDAGSASPR